MARYFVRNINGSDANDGLSFANAKQTIEAAAEQATVAGDIVEIVDEGTNYNGRNGSGLLPVRPRGSGASGNLITIRGFLPDDSSPQHRPVIDGTDPDPTGDGNVGLNYTDGITRNFVLFQSLRMRHPSNPNTDNGLGIQVLGTNNVLDNVEVDRGVRSPTGAGNPNSVRLNGSSCIIRNCLIRAAQGSSSHDNNRAIHLEGAHNNLIHNNEIYGRPSGVLGGGIGWKRAGNDNIVRHNFIHSLDQYGVYIKGEEPSLNEEARRNSIFQNLLVFVNVLGGKGAIHVEWGAEVGEVEDTAVYNNTLFGVRRGLTSGGAPGGNTGFYRLYNNLVHLETHASDTRYQEQSANLPSGFLIDYHAYRRANGTHEFAGAWQIAGSPYGTLANWQGHAGSTDDNGGSLSDPVWVNPGTLVPVDYKLQATSPFLATGSNPGKSDGTPTGSNVNRGCYLSDSDIIGRGAILVIEGTWLW
jgi:hypothetical protein